MRKTLIAAVAAFSVLAMATVAVAQAPGAAINVAVTPTKAGTAKKPAPAKLTLEVKNQDSSKTAQEIQIFHAKQIKVDTTGIKTCPKLASTLDPSGCSASKLGTGTADAIAGVNTSAPAPLKFSVTAYMLSKTKIGFLIKQQGGEITTLATGTFKKASGKYGKMLDVSIPQIAREYPQGSFNGLVGLKTTLFKKVGKHSLYSTTGCPKSKKLPFRTIIKFQSNPNPPVPASVTSDGTASCK